MLLKNEKKEFIEMYKNKIEDYNSLNEKIFEIYKTENLEKTGLDICNCIKLSEVTPEFLEKIWSYVKDTNKSSALANIICGNKNFSSKESTDFIISNSNKNFFSMSESINLLFRLIEYQRDRLQFNELDLKKIYSYYKEKGVLNDKIFKLQKNINFILEEEKVDILCIERIVSNEKVNSDFLLKFLEKYSTRLSNEDWENLAKKCKINEEIMKKYSGMFSKSSLVKNKHISEDFINKYLKEEISNLRVQNLSKKFLEDNITKVNYGLIFNNIKTEKDYEYFLDLIMSKTEKVEETLPIILNFIKNNENANFSFYNKMIKKYGLETKPGDLILYMNENTEPKYNNIIEKFLKSIENGEIPDDIIDRIEHLNGFVNIPDDLITKYIKVLSYEKSDYKNNMYELLSNQKLSVSLKTKFFSKTSNEDFVTDYLTKYKKCISSQVSNKRELKILNELSGMRKEELKNFEHLLLMNFSYFSTLTNKEIMEMIKKIDNNTKNQSVFHLFMFMENNQNQMVSKRKVDFGLSIF